MTKQKKPCAYCYNGNIKVTEEREKNGGEIYDAELRYKYCPMCGKKLWE